MLLTFLQCSVCLSVCLSNHYIWCVHISVLNSGGWTVLHNWLLHSKAHECRTFLIELLKLYKQLPVTVELLRQNSCAKDIKQLAKCTDSSKLSLLLSLFCNAWAVIILYCFVQYNSLHVSDICIHYESHIGDNYTFFPVSLLDADQF